MPYVPKNWQKEPITKQALNALEQAVANAVAVNENHVAQAVGAHPAAAISYAGSSNLSSANVEAALDELDAEKAGLAVANVFTQRNTFQGGIQDGDSNVDTSLLYSLGIPLDTRSLVPTAWNTENKPTALELRNGAMVVGTIGITWNTDGHATQVVAAAGGYTVTYTLTWTGDKFTGYTKVVA